MPNAGYIIISNKSMIISNQNSNPNSPQTHAYNLYRQKKYPQALQLYNQALRQPYLSPINKLYLETTIAILYIHMNNYIQAHQMLMALAGRRDRVLRECGVGDELMQYLLVFLKVEASLLVIQLANCDQKYTQEHVQNIFNVIQYASYTSNKSNHKNNNQHYQDEEVLNNKRVLFQSLMMMLFGYSSFEQLYSDAQLKVSKSVPLLSQQPVLSSSTTPTFLSALSITLQLIPNLQLSYQIEHLAYQLSRTHNPPQVISMLVSCKHLIRLCQKLNNHNGRTTYQREFDRLMQMPEVYGISQVTLFRSYDQKIQIGRWIVSKVGQYGGSLGEGDLHGGHRSMGKVRNSRDDDSSIWLHKKLVYKLQQTLYNLQNSPANQSQNLSRQSLIRALNSLNSKTGLHMLSYMKSSQLVQSILREQRSKLDRLVGLLGRICVTGAWRHLLGLPPVLGEQVGYSYTVFKANNQNTGKFNSNISINGKANVNINSNTPRNNRSIPKQANLNMQTNYDQGNQHNIDDKQKNLNLNNTQTNVNINSNFNSKNSRSISKNMNNNDLYINSNNNPNAINKNNMEVVAQSNNDNRNDNSMYREQYKQKIYKKQVVIINDGNRNNNINNKNNKYFKNTQQRQQEQQKRIQQQQKIYQQHQRRQQQQQQQYAQYLRQQQEAQQLRIQKQQEQQEQYRRQQQQYYREEQARQRQRENQEYYQRQERFNRERQEKDRQDREYQEFVNKQDRDADRPTQAININKYNRDRNTSQHYTISHTNRERQREKQREINISRQRDLSRQERDFSRDNQKQYYQGTRTQLSPKLRRKIQHVSVIPKSPRHRVDSSSPIHNKQGIETSRLKINKNKNIDLNNSKIANHMNGVYLDSDSSRFVNPLSELEYDQFSREREKEREKGEGDPDYDYSRNVEENVGGQLGGYTNNNIIRTERSNIGRKMQTINTNRNKQIPNTNMPTNTSINNNMLAYNSTPNTNPNIINNVNTDNNEGIMNIMKSQNTRIKNTYQYQEVSVNNQNSLNKELNKSTTVIKQVEEREETTHKQSNNINNNSSNINPSMSITNPTRNQSTLPPPNTYVYNPVGYQTSQQAAQVFFKPNNTNTNINNPLPSIQTSAIRNLSPSRLDQDQVQFNNVDIVIQPAVNPNNISNITDFTNINTNANNRKADTQYSVSNSQIRPINKPKNEQTNINNPRANTNTPIYQPPPSPSPQNQMTRPPQISKQPTIKMTSSESAIQPKKVQKLTAQSPYIKKLMRLCNEGQYFGKKNYSSDGGEEKFVRLAPDMVKWAVDQDKIATKYQSYKLKDIKGIVYGKVSETFLKQCNKKCLPWLCFSLVLQKRTLDFYCSQQIDPMIWLPGLTAALDGYTLPLRYAKKKNNKSSSIGYQQVPISLFTPGKVLWKRVLMKLKQTFIKPIKKGNRKFKNQNAYAIILWHNEFQRLKPIN